MPRLFMPITIRISKPIDCSRYYDRADDPLVLRQVTDEIMFELRELSGQEYVNQYAKRKDDAGMAADAAKVAAPLAG
jgi:1-acyl-sn-glycerol-3-phosphate acyltransferase